MVKGQQAHTQQVLVANRSLTTEVFISPVIYGPWRAEIGSVELVSENLF